MTFIKEKEISGKRSSKLFYTPAVEGFTKRHTFSIYQYENIAAYISALKVLLKGRPTNSLFFAPKIVIGNPEETEKAIENVLKKIEVNADVQAPVALTEAELKMDAILNYPYRDDEGGVDWYPLCTDGQPIASSVSFHHAVIDGELLVDEKEIRKRYAEQAVAHLFYEISISEDVFILRLGCSKLNRVAEVLEVLEQPLPPSHVIAEELSIELLNKYIDFYVYDEVQGCLSRSSTRTEALLGLNRFFIVPELHGCLGHVIDCTTS